MNSWLCDDPILKAHLQRVEDLAHCCGNPDSIDALNAAKNLHTGKAAFWYRGKTSPASHVVALSNCDEHGRSFLGALVVIVERHPQIDVAKDILDSVIPLNGDAIAELGLCYRLQSTFRENLAGRERAAIYEPYFLPNMSAAGRAEWMADYRVVQARFEERQLPLTTNPRAALAIALSSVTFDDVARVAVEGQPISEVA